MRVMRSFTLALPPLLRIDQAAGITQDLTIGPPAPLWSFGSATFSTGHSAVRLAVAAARRPVRVGTVVFLVIS